MQLRRRRYGVQQLLQWQPNKSSRSWKKKQPENGLYLLATDWLFPPWPCVDWRHYTIDGNNGIGVDHERAMPHTFELISMKYLGN